MGRKDVYVCCMAWPPPHRAVATGAWLSLEYPRHAVGSGKWIFLGVKKLNAAEGGYLRVLQEARENGFSLRCVSNAHEGCHRHIEQ